jgi:hypothetical protein
MGYEIITIDFKRHFVENPSVALSINGYIITSTNFAADCSVAAVTPGFFKVKVSCDDDIKFLQISWLATVSSQSGIYVIEKDLSFSGTSSINAVVGERAFGVVEDHHWIFRKSQAAVGLAGWTFYNCEGGDVVFSICANDLKPNKFTLDLKLDGETKIKHARVFILYFETDSTTHRVFNSKIDSEHCGDHKNSYKIGTGSDNVRGVWNGLTELNLINLNPTHDLHSKVYVKNGKMYVNYNKWFNEEIIEVTNNVFITNTIKGGDQDL